MGNYMLHSAFRTYALGYMLDTEVVPLSELPTNLAWGRRLRHRDTLYSGAHPFVFYIPASVTYIAFDENFSGLYNFTIELSPIALRDILALDILCYFIDPVDRKYMATPSNAFKLIISSRQLSSRHSGVCYTSMRGRRTYKLFGPDDCTFISITGHNSRCLIRLRHWVHCVG